MSRGQATNLINPNDSNSNSIREWNASFYEQATQQWRNGVLKLFPMKILFCQDRRVSNERDQKASAFEFEMPFRDVLCVKRATSSLVFPAITISTSKNDKYWLSSLANRDETLLFIEYFYLSMPVNRQERVRQEISEDGGQSTSMGKELLRTVVDSNKCLTEAGNQLVEQGHQLRNASVKMVEINNDVGVASSLTKGLKSWLPRWRIPKAYNNDESFLVLNRDDALDICNYNALYRDISPNVKGSLIQCEVTVEKKGLSVLDFYQKIIQHFGWADVSRVQVVSPWELCMTQFLIGKPDRKCNIVSVKTEQLLKEIKRYRPDKIDDISPAVKFAWSRRESLMWEECQSSRDATRNSQQDSLLWDNDESNLPSQTQIAPSNQEMADLSKELSSLKSLAMDVQKVQDEQSKDIDGLTSAVTKETDRLSKLNKTIKRIT